MDKRKEFTEKAFDRIFLEKEKLSYRFNDDELSIRDLKVKQQLLEVGVFGKKYLDIGPGTGRWLQFVKNNGASYCGAIDISQESLNRCNKLCDKTQKADVECEIFNFESSYFDIVVSFMVLEHLKNPENYLNEIIRVTKSGGLILMTIPNILSFLSRLRVIIGKLPSAITDDHTHVKYYTKKELKKLFKPYNLFPVLIPTSISWNPFAPKKLLIPSNKLIKSLDDHLLFRIIVNK
ncbi:MAG: class I SAM-dependent methyltransferase [Ignavibacteria bacterium]